MIGPHGPAAAGAGSRNEIASGRPGKRRQHHLIPFALPRFLCPGCHGLPCRLNNGMAPHHRWCAVPCRPSPPRRRPPLLGIGMQPEPGEPRGRRSWRRPCRLYGLWAFPSAPCTENPCCVGANSRGAGQAAGARGRPGRVAPPRPHATRSFAYSWIDRPSVVQLQRRRDRYRAGPGLVNSGDRSSLAWPMD